MGDSSFYSPTLHMEDRFEGPTLRIDGLPALKGKLRLELDGGERVELEFDLEEGVEKNLTCRI